MARVRDSPLSGFVGQRHVNELRHALKRRERLGSDTPFNVIFFCPPGVGKTELAKYLSAWRSGLTFEEVNSAEGRITIFDMGAFKDEVSVNTFFGAHAGFQGGEGKLYKALRCNPRGVFIFDEVEKAHSKVFDSLLPLMNRNGSSRTRLAMIQSRRGMLSSFSPQTSVQSASNRSMPMSRRP